MRPIEWMKQVLQRHDIDKPDGRPLYQYRITDEEFESLTHLLKLSSNLGFTNISRMLMWDAALVFYAAEWWRRYYSGQWSWEGIFDSLGIASEDIATSRRNEVVELGLQRWQRQVRRINDRRQFLGTVATEGGLPLQRLTDAGGWLNGVLRPVIRRHLSRGIEIDKLLTAYGDAIPQSYRSAEMSQILADLVTCVTDIRKQHDFSDKADPVDCLDKNDPNWRDAFPLPIESDVAKALLTDLIKEAVKVTGLDTATGSIFQLDRYLINETIRPEVKAKLELPQIILAARLNDLDQENLPARIDFELSNDLGESRMLCRGFRTVKHNDVVYKLVGQSQLFSSESALSSFQLKLKSEGSMLGHVQIDQAQRLETDEPWLFRKIAERWELQGAASQKIADAEAMIYIPDSLHVSLGEETDLLNLKHAYQGKFYSLLGSVICKDESHAKYELCTKAQESYLQYDLCGTEYEGLSYPGRVFVGLPSLLERNAITGHTNKKSISNMKAKPLGIDTKWRNISDDMVGVHELRLIDSDGSILCKRRVGLLPSDFDIELEADRSDARAGKVNINGLSGLILNVIEGDFRAHTSYQNEQHSIALSANSTPPRSLTVAMLPEAHKHELSLVVPFPSRGSMLYTPEGKAVTRGQNLYLSNLYGYRIKVFKDHRARSHTAQIRFSLNDEKMDTTQLRDVYVNKTLKLNGAVTEFILIDWHDIIQEMLGVSSNLDSFVRISFLNDGAEELSINVHRYELDLVADWQEGTLSFSTRDMESLSTEELEGIKFKCLLLNQPEQHAQEIVAVTSQGAVTGMWDFQLAKRPSGPWIIYPDVESSISFRPLLWNVMDEYQETDFVHVESVDTLQKAILIEENEKREQAIKLVMHQMTLDVKHKSWAYLENLHQTTKHLPLAAFDIWRVSVTEPGFIASLFVKEQYVDVIEKLVAELPIIWELVRLSEWETALHSYKAYLVGSMCCGDPQIDEVIYSVEQLVIKVIKRIEGLGASMQSICKILKFSVLEIEDKELGLFRLPFNMFVESDLLHNHQDLIRRNSENEWPVLLQKQIKERFSTMPHDIQKVLEPRVGFQSAATYLPAILATRVHNQTDYGWLGSSVNVFKLEQLKNFDEEWFSAAFQSLSGWLYFHGQIEK